ncbi:beta-ketoacyl-ACP synthase [Hirschia maritima]|uniref:beta-ketoacyl-ACP synthase n=1 Tax=Hirschia maritima TaxID=1121961 RepID=UPI000380E106|nr:beta-ketoacyl-ACP synthase [Hirschia maritima]
MRRVVVTGMAGMTALGNSFEEISPKLNAQTAGIRNMPEWEEYTDMSTRLGGPIDGFVHEKAYPRQARRSMGRLAVMMVKMGGEALEHAGLTDDPIVKSGRMGVAAGSSYGSTPATLDFVEFLETGKAKGLNATSYIRMMSHTAPVNMGVYFGLQGRVYTTSSACTSGAQGLGYAFEAILSGAQDLMMAGGSDEFCPTMTMVFDRLYATSTRNDDPQHAVRPFDETRDGLVIGEAASVLILEELEHALARGAKPIAEIVGFSTNCDGQHISQPNRKTQEVVMRQALEQSGLSVSDLSFVSGHGTGTATGDVEESHATHAVFGDRVPFHTLKGNFGHTLGACGAIETWLGIEQLKEGQISPIANLANVDPKCADLDYVIGNTRKVSKNAFSSSNFAFGGINTSLVVSNYE